MTQRDAYVAIADPTRRQILDLLRDHLTSTAGEIARQFSGVTRPAISRHLKILRECGLVNVKKNGKLQNYSLNPQPLIEMRENWLLRFADMQTESLVDLRKAVESKNN